MYIGIEKNILPCWNLVYEVSREWQGFIVQLRKTTEISSKSQTRNTEGSCWYSCNKLPGAALNGEHYQFVTQRTDLPSSSLKSPRRLPALQVECPVSSLGQALLLQAHAEILKLVHLLPIPCSSACALQPNHYCSEMIFHRAVKTLKSQSTTLFQWEERIKIFYPCEISP